jgi:hypothetical protein
MVALINYVLYKLKSLQFAGFFIRPIPYSRLHSCKNPDCRPHHSGDILYPFLIFPATASIPS